MELTLHANVHIQYHHFSWSTLDTLNSIIWWPSCILYCIQRQASNQLVFMKLLHCHAVLLSLPRPKTAYGTLHINDEISRSTLLIDLLNNAAFMAITRIVLNNSMFMNVLYHDLRSLRLCMNIWMKSFTFRMVLM